VSRDQFRNFGTPVITGKHQR